MRQVNRRAVLCSQAESNQFKGPIKIGLPIHRKRVARCKAFEVLGPFGIVECRSFERIFNILISSRSEHRSFAQSIFHERSTRNGITVSVQHIACNDSLWAWPRALG